MKNKKSIVEYWKLLAKNDIKVMESLFREKHYPYALFVGHLAIEKLLKSYYVFKRGEHPPFIHDLVRLSTEAGLSLSDKEKVLLDAISQFNIEARYPDIKLSFYKKADRIFTEKYMKEIKGFYQWLKKKIQL